MLGLLMAGLLLPLFISGVIYLILTAILMKQLKIKHKSVWDELGKPAFFDGAIKSDHSFVLWVFFGKYMSLKDENTIRVAQWTRFFLYLGGISFLIELYLFFVELM